MAIDTSLDKMMTFCERPPPLKPLDPFIIWPMWGHMVIWKINISNFSIRKAIKLDRMLTTGRRFSMQMLESSPTSYFFWNRNKSTFNVSLMILNYSIINKTLKVIQQMVLLKDTLLKSKENWMLHDAHTYASIETRSAK